MQRPVTVSVEVAGNGFAPFIQGLADTLNFEAVRNVAPALLGGRPVLLHGWRPLYCEAAGRHPGQCHVVWHHGLAETEALGEGARLASALQHLRTGQTGLFWTELGDTLPEGARELPPVWSGSRLARRRGNRPAKRAGHVMIDGGGELLSATLGALHAGATVHVPRAAMIPSGTLKEVARAEALRAMADGRVAHYEPGDVASLAAASDLVMFLDDAATWSYALLETVYAGTPALISPAVTWASFLPDEIHDACVVSPAKSSALVREMVSRLLRDVELRHAVLDAQRQALEALEPVHLERARCSLEAAGFELQEANAAPRVAAVPSRKSLVLYSDVGAWAQYGFCQELARQAPAWGFAPIIASGTNLSTSRDVTFYSPCHGAADRIRSYGVAEARTGLWSHVSYGGWFTDDPLRRAELPASPAHATNLYLHGLTGLPYLAGGVDSDLFRPSASGRRADSRLTVGWTGSLQYNAAVKLFLDLWITAVRRAGSDGPLAKARICARPLPVWDCEDARSAREVAAYLQSIDIYLCASISEGCSLSVLEAASAGCVIISTPCGNAPELATEIVGWNASEIAGAVLRFDQDRKTLREASERTRDLVERFWAWTSPIKSEAWRAWLHGESVPSWREQLPYMVETPETLLARSRQLREMARPTLQRGDMYRS